MRVGLRELRRNALVHSNGSATRRKWSRPHATSPRACSNPPRRRRGRGSQRRARCRLRDTLGWHRERPRLLARAPFCRVSCRTHAPAPLPPGPDDFPVTHLPTDELRTEPVTPYSLEAVNARIREESAFVPELLAEIAATIVGQRQMVAGPFSSGLSDGHVLLEGSRGSRRRCRCARPRRLSKCSSACSSRRICAAPQAGHDLQPAHG